MRLFQLVRSLAFALLVVCTLPVGAQVQTDLSGLWTGQSSGNQVKLEMRSGGFAQMLAGTQNAGQKAGEFFFRDAGLGIYLHTKPDGNDVRVQVLGPNTIRVTNPDGWTDVFTRPATVVATLPPAATPPVEKRASANPPQARAQSEPPERKAAAIADFRRSCSHLGDAGTLAHYEANVFLDGRFDENGRPYSAQYWQDKIDNGTVMSPYQCTLQVLQRHTLTGVPGFDDAAGPAAASDSTAQTVQYGTPAVPSGGALSPLSAGGPTTKSVQEGKDARIIARDGRVATDCVKLVNLSSGDSTTTGLGGRVLSNQCEGPVTVGWCYVGGECERDSGNMTTIQANYSWPVSAEKDIRWGACHGANTIHGEPGSSGLRFTCSKPNI